MLPYYYTIAVLVLGAASGSALDLGSSSKGPSADPASVRVQDPRFLPALQRARLEAQEAAAVRAAPEKNASAAKAWENALRAAAERALPQDTVTVVVEARGAWLTRGGARMPAAPSAALREGDVLSVGPEGRIVVRLEDGARLALAPGASVSFRQLPRPGSSDSALALSAGKIFWQAPRLPLGKALILTSRSQVALRDSRAEISVDAQGVASIRPLGGSLEARAEPAPASAASWWE